ncbi:MAG: flagellar FlbD family protein [Thermacetogeniaceae bacterium]
MIKVTRLNGEGLYVNSDLIEFIEETPDTVLSLTTSKKIVVKENAEEVIRRIIDFRRKIAEGVPRRINRCGETSDVISSNRE